MSEGNFESKIVESIGIKGRRVGETILELDEELALGNSLGIAYKRAYEVTSYSLLLGRQPLRKWILFPKRRPLIGYLMIETNGNKDKRWLMLIHGRCYCDRMERLAGGLTEAFGTEIHLRLESEEPSTETFWGDDL